MSHELETSAHPAESRVGADATPASGPLRDLALPAGVVAGLLLGFGLLTLTDAAFIDKLLYILLLSLVAVSVNFTHSATGELALGQVGVFAAGAYGYAVTTNHYGWNGWLGLAFGTVFAGLIGIIAALPSLRIGSWYFALTSLFIAVVIPDLARQIPSLTGGSDGLAGIPPLVIGSHALTFKDVYGVAVVLVVMLLAALRILTHSRYGLAFDSLRRSPVFATSLGVSVVRTKALAYGFASVVSGLAGGLFAAVNGYVSPDAFPVSLSILVVAGAVVGGQESVVGPVVGVAILQLLPDYTSSVQRYSLLLYGGILVIVMLLVPRGLVPVITDGLRRGWRRIGPRRPDTPSASRRLASSSPVDVALPRAQLVTDLEVVDVAKAFGGVQALGGISFDAPAGFITAVIGPNGSGKTTLLNLITAVYPRDAGYVRLGGVSLARRRHRVAAQGVARTFQTPMIMAERTVVDNVQAGAFLTGRATFLESLLGVGRARAEQRRGRERALALLAEADLLHIAHRDAGEVSLGQQRKLEIVRSLALNPRLLLLDEPCAGLMGREVEELEGLLKRVRDAGYSIVLVEHNMSLVMSLADRVVVLDQGQVIAVGPPDEVQASPEVIAAYLGDDDGA